MSTRREVLRNWIGTAGINRPDVNLETKRTIFSEEATTGLINITKLRVKIPGIEEVFLKSSEDPKSEKPAAENIKPDSRVVSINRVGKEDLRRLRRRRGPCGCSSTAEKPCQRRSCRARTNTRILKAA